MFQSVLEQRLQEDTGIDPPSPPRFQIKVQHKDGSQIDVEITARFIRDDAGKPVGLIGTTRDVRDRGGPVMKIG